jgi:hypothetical protein
MNNSAVVRDYLQSIGRDRAHEMTAPQIHNEIFDLHDRSIPVSTIHTVRLQFTGRTKSPRNSGKFNRAFKTT